MQLYSLGFLFLFLPVGGLIYYFLHSNGRRWFLLLYSLLFVALLSPLCLLLLLAVMVPDYLLAQFLADAGQVFVRIRKFLRFATAKTDAPDNRFLSIPKK